VALKTTQHHTKDQVMHPVKGVPGAVDLHFFDHIPAQKGRHQPAQPKDMIKMTVGQQNLIQALKTNASTQDLALSPLTAIHQEAKFFMLNK
jgi:hypothetical protein